jgi:hypothetical protein
MHRSRIQRIFFISLTFFFLAALAFAFHPDDNTFLLRSRSICKVKTSPPGTMSKSKIDSAPTVTVISLDLASFIALFATAPHENTAIFISSQVVHIWPNKAPPVSS